VFAAAGFVGEGQGGDAASAGQAFAEFFALVGGHEVIIGAGEDEEIGFNA